MTEEKKASFSFGFIILVFCTATIIIATIILISSIFHIQYRTENDFLNWTAIVIEIGVAAFISGIVLLYDRKHKRRANDQQERMSALLNETKNQQDKIADLVTKIEKIETRQLGLNERLFEITEEQEKIRKNRRTSAYQEMLSYLDQMKYFIEEVESYSDSDLENAYA